jgi:hypothetical protein
MKPQVMKAASDMSGENLQRSCGISNPVSESHGRCRINVGYDTGRETAQVRGPAARVARRGPSRRRHGRETPAFDTS